MVLPKNSGLQEYKKEFEKLENEKIIVRAEDVPLFVELIKQKGKNCIGLTGEDLFEEYSLNKKTSLEIVQTIPWNDSTTLFGKPTLCLLGNKEKELSNSTIAVNKKYSKITKNYFKEKQPKQIIYFSGCTEEAFDAKITDFVVDIVYSGESAKEVGLEIIDKLFESNVVVIR